jgi:hypothetical protein
MTLAKDIYQHNRTYQVHLNKITMLAKDDLTMPVMSPLSNPSTPGKRKAGTPVLAPPEE